MVGSDGMFTLGSFAGDGAFGGNGLLSITLGSFSSVGAMAFRAVLGNCDDGNGCSGAAKRSVNIWCKRMSAERVCVLTGGSNGDLSACFSACVRSLAAAMMMSSADEVGMWMLCGSQVTVSAIRSAPVDGIQTRCWR